ncbi:transmembrane amino acid transporter protein-domain-containing protein [Cunninghamella echinulata]|nr:transmembrane amino acid transporter protein-domain-containing protein [Cunninghamella echinulata]
MPNTTTESPRSTEGGISSPKYGRSRPTSVIIEEGREQKSPTAAGGTRPRPRPKLSSRATSFAHSAKRASMGARSYSTMSLYTNFAGEHLDDEGTSQGYRTKRAISEEKSNVPNDDSAIETEQVRATPTASVGKAMFMFLKAFIGSGVLFLPKAYANGGVALSNILMVIIAMICLIAFLHLIKTQLVVGGSYGDMGGTLFGPTLRYIVLFFIVISQIGFVCSYFIFVSGNFYSVANVLSACRNHIEQKNYIWFPLILLIPMSLIRHMARLSFAAIAADVLILFGLIVIIYFSSDQLYNHGPGPGIVAVNSMDFGLTIGTATFSFEGIGLLIPIVESMADPHKFPIVTIFGMIIVCCIYVLIGTLSYMAYGDQIQAAVIYNFPPDNRLNISVELLYSLAVMLTMPFMLFPALKIIENGIFRKFKSGRDSITVKFSKNIYRVIISVICAVIAYGIGGENLDKFVAFVGSVACVPLCFIFPGLFHIKVAKRLWEKIIDMALIIWGVGIMIYTLYVTINSWVHPGHAEVLTPYCPL